MLVAKGLSKNKIAILASIIVIALVGAGYLLYTTYFKDKINIDIPFVKSASSELFGPEVFLPNLDTFDANFFDDHDIKQLNNVGQLPITVENTGRVNPFAPLIIINRSNVSGNRR